ncbi:MAG: hypothetical protein Q7T75_01020, partial [Mesorhizobium sp.]|nr:hypothetical protein [Mesorhizobium sp.]
VLSLALAAWQGFGALLAMRTGTFIRPDAIAFVPVGLAAYIGSTALMIWLADNFGPPDLGGGFWPLAAMITIASFPERFSTLVNLFHIGQIPERELLVVVLSLVVGLALVVFANKLLSRNVSAGGVAKTSILLWPSYLAAVVAGHAAILLPHDMFDWPFVAVSFVEATYVALTTILIPVFVFAYARRFLRSKTDGPQQWPLPILLAISAIQMLLCIGIWLLPISLRIPPMTTGAELLVVGTVMLALVTVSAHTPPLPSSRRR